MIRNKKFKTIMCGAVLASATSSFAQEWGSQIDATGTFLGGNPALIENGSGADRDVKFYITQPIVAVKVVSPTGKVSFLGTFNLDVLARRHLNMNGSAERGSSGDGRGVRHIIENLSAEVALAEKVSLSAGLGKISFLMPEDTLMSQISRQDELYNIRERLFAEIAIDLAQNTKMFLTVFDGTEQKAVDVLGSFGHDDLVDIVDISSGRMKDSASGMARIEQDTSVITEILGLDASNTSLAYAKVRNYDNAGGEKEMVAMSIDATKEIMGYAVTGLVQYVRSIGAVDLDSVVGELRTRKGNLTAYTQIEVTEEGVAKTEARRGTIGLRGDMSMSGVNFSPFAELFIQDDQNVDRDLGAIIGIRALYGKGR